MIDRAVNYLGHLVTRLKRPKVIYVEPTNHCNLDCPFCLVGLQAEYPSAGHRLLPRQLGFMDFALFEKVARDAVNFGIKTIMLHFQGEPLLHERFVDMVRLSKKYGLSAGVFTNGLLLNDGLAEQLINAGLDNMRFSIDGISEQTYQENRRGGTFAQAYKNMEMMVKKAEGTQLKLVWQFIALRNNEHEIEDARKIAERIGIRFFLKTFAATNPGLVPANPDYIRKLKEKPCSDIYRIIYVFWNGDVVCCCYDLAGKYMVGNLKYATLLEIWNSPEYRQLRKRIDNAVENPDAEPAICKSCLRWGAS